MKMFAKLIGLLTVLTLLVNCGGGGGASFTSGGDTGGDSAAVNSISLLADTVQLGSSGASSVTLTAIVKDSSNVVMEDQAVTFSTNSGSLQVIRGTTDATGTAQATLSTGGNKDNRTITVTATASGKTDTVDVSVNGTNLSISGATTIGFGEQATLTITLKDSAGTGISGETLSIEGDVGVTLSTTSVTTGASGQASVTVTGVSDPGTVTVTGAGAAAIHDITVSSDSLTFTSPAADTEVDLGDSQSVTARLTSSGVGVDGATVNFAATRGALSAPSAVTAGGGYATVSISSDDSGPVVVSATSDSLTAVLDMEFVATTADSLTLQASPATIGVNSDPDNPTQVSTITAVVRDADNNLVKNKTVNFTLVDVSGGEIYPASAVTDTYGRASTVYTAGSSSSANDGVEIAAVVVGTPSANDTVFLTVAQEALFITLGTGNSITEPNSTTYSLPYTVLVTDATGAPVANKTVVLSVIPTEYYKGIWDNSSDEWLQVPSDDACENEDANLNGLLDAGDDDLNSDGILQPGSPVTLSSGSVTTDSEGFASFNVRYPQDRAYWVAVDLIAQASVAGSESTGRVNFIVPGIASDYADADTAVPGNPSPYGFGTCAEDF